MKNKTSVVLLILLFLLIVAIVFVVLSSLDKKLNPPDAPAEPEEAEFGELLEPSPAPTETAVEPTVVTPAPETPEPTVAVPVPTMAPFPVVETPAPSTVPMPVPTEKPGDPLGSGSFKSRTNTGLDVRAEWSAETYGTETAKIRVTVYVDSWSLILNAAEKTVNISLSGQYVSLDAPAVVHRENKALSTEIGSATFVVPLAEGESITQNLQVEWHYNGTYGGMSIPSIECGGEIALSR